MAAERRRRGRGHHRHGMDPRVVRRQAHYAGQDAQDAPADSRGELDDTGRRRAAAVRAGWVIGVAALLILAGFVVPELSGPLWVLAMTIIGAAIVHEFAKPTRPKK